MGRSIFGWSYPPGCSGPPEEPDPPEESQEAWEILDNAGVSDEVKEKICDIIERLVYAAYSECEFCLQRQAEEEQKSIDEFKRLDESGLT